MRINHVIIIIIIIIIIVIIIIKKDNIYVLELTCCFKTNSEKSRTFKEENTSILKEIAC